MLESYLHWLGFGLCHQLPERSFFGGGVQVSVCARDTGIYVGVLLSLLLVSILHRRSRPRGFPTTGGWIVILLMIGAMGLDGVTSYSGLRTTTNDLRLATGLLAGFAIGALLSPMLDDVVWRTGSPESVLSPAWRLGAWFLGVPVAFFVVRDLLPLLGVGYPVLMSFAIWGTLIAVNLVMVCLLPPFERKADRLLDAWLPMLVAFGMSFAEIWVAGLLRTGLESLVGRL